MKIRTPAEPKRIATDGIITLDSNRGKRFGFTHDLFDGYLWKRGKRIIISFIESREPGKGHLKALFDRIESLGYTIAVPTPSNRMRMICEKRGMVACREGDYEMMQRKDSICVQAGWCGTMKQEGTVPLYFPSSSPAPGASHTRGSLPVRGQDEERP